MSVRRHRSTIKERRNEVEEELLRLLEHAVAKSNIPLAADQLPTSLNEVGSKVGTSSTIASLENELAEMTRQRDQAIYRSLQIERENEDLNERLHKTSGVMQAYQSLKKVRQLKLIMNSGLLWFIFAKKHACYHRITRPCNYHSIVPRQFALSKRLEIKIVS